MDKQTLTTSKIVISHSTLIRDLFPGAWLADLKEFNKLNYET
jgi:hypothetical protein